tara:strand:+ start:104 stop:808 length:705 start_codon:yes stop_codon:yes gene_type:complete
MFKKLFAKRMGTSNLGWLESRFHFSFAEYVNHDNINFGVLRVLNDDIIHAKGGFGKHSHTDMEIISYIVKGEITHQDSMGNSEILKRGEVQYLSAGTGITHAEFNENESEALRLLQIWIVPPKKSLTPLYGSHKFDESESKNKILGIVSSVNGKAKIKIHQDINIYVSRLEKNNRLDFEIDENRQVYFVQIEGTSLVNNIELNHGDAMEIRDELSIDILAISNSHCLFIEMKKL